MKRLSTYFIALLSLFILLSCSNNSSKFPKNNPTTTITINDRTYECHIGNGNWFAEAAGGNSRMGCEYDQFNDTCSFIEVDSEDEITFDVSYKDNIKVISLNLVNFDSAQKALYTELSTDEYSFKAPTEKGEYNYSFRVTWDDTHNLDYLFKLKVK